MKRFLKFFCVNLSGTLVDTLVLGGLALLFESYAMLYIVAPVLAFECAVLNNFTVSYCWVWRDRVGSGRSEFWARFSVYHANALGVFLGRLALIAVLGKAFALPVVLCNLLALLVSGLFNFGAQDRVVFARL